MISLVTVYILMKASPRFMVNDRLVSGHGDRNGEW